MASRLPTFPQPWIGWGHKVDCVWLVVGEVGFWSPTAGDVGATGIGTDGEPVTRLVGTLAYRPARLAAVGRRDHRLGPATGSATTAEHHSRTLVICEPVVDCDLECIHGLTTNEHGCEVCRCKTSEQDVNECTVNRGGCEHDCVDTEEGYNCTCRDGYNIYNTYEAVSGIYAEETLTLTRMTEALGPTTQLDTNV
ncbi:Coagulation factor 5/8 C-terminal domain, discoidin domain [Branchiostoma belcheri]|nr:Coagulation factor 5/8 C-terminal domain, discoidin domain [Branchiostoma belcheri]